MVIADPAFGLKLADWDDEAPTQAQWLSFFEGLKASECVSSQFTVVIYCSFQMVPAIQLAALEAACSTNPQRLDFLSDQPVGGRGNNSFSTHLCQEVLVFFFDKEHPGKGGSRKEFGFDFSKVNELRTEARLCFLSADNNCRVSCYTMSYAMRQACVPIDSAARTSSCLS